MNDALILSYLGFILFAAAGFSLVSTCSLIGRNRISLDKGFLLSLSACMIGLLLCLSLWPPVHRVFDDEYWYISQSFNILSFGKAGVILKGSLNHPEVMAPWSYTCKLPGYGLLESMILLGTADFERSFFVLNLLLGTLLIAVVYRIAWAWTADHSTAWWTAVFLACLPVRITYSMSAASDISGLFFFSLFILYLSEYRHSPRTRFLYAALFCGLYSFCLRSFYGLLVLVAMAAFLQIYRRAGLASRRVVWAIGLVTFCLFFPLIVMLPSSGHFYGNQGTYSFAAMLKNLGAILSYLFSPRQTSIIITIAAVAAVFRAAHNKSSGSINVLAGWLMGGLLAVCCFRPGGVSYPGEAYSDRYFLFVALPYCLLAARGMEGFSARFPGRGAAALVLIILMADAAHAAHKLDVRAKGNPYLKKAAILKQIAPLVPRSAYLIEETASLAAAVTPLKTIQTDYFLTGDHPQEVIFLQGLTDSTDAARSLAVKQILKEGYQCQPQAAARAGHITVTPYVCRRSMPRAPG